MVIGDHATEDGYVGPISDGVEDLLQLALALALLLHVVKEGSCDGRPEPGHRYRGGLHRVFILGAIRVGDVHAACDKTPGLVARLRGQLFGTALYDLGGHTPGEVLVRTAQRVGHPSFSARHATRCGEQRLDSEHGHPDGRVRTGRPAAAATGAPLGIEHRQEGRPRLTFQRRCTGGDGAARRKGLGYEVPCTALARLHHLAPVAGKTVVGRANLFDAPHHLRQLPIGRLGGLEVRPSHLAKAPSLEEGFLVTAQEGPNRLDPRVERGTDREEAELPVADLAAPGERQPAPDTLGRIARCHQHRSPATNLRERLTEIAEFVCGYQQQ